MAAQEDHVHPERRRAARYPVVLEIDVDGAPGVTVNLSTSGVYFETAHAVQPDQQLALLFPFEHAAPSGTRASCTARVLRVDHRDGRHGVAATYETVAFDMP